jgi:hypothetical protein
MPNAGWLLVLLSLGLLLVVFLFLHARSSAAGTVWQENVLVFDQGFQPTAKNISVHVVHYGEFLVDPQSIPWPVEIFVDKILRT